MWEEEIGKDRTSLGYCAFNAQTNTPNKELHAGKDSRREVRGKAYAVPALKFENQSLTSFSGLVIFQEFFALLRLKVRLARCFAHQTAGKVFGRATLFLQLMVHLLLGYRELRESRYYQDDPLGKRLLGLKRLPDVATVSRMLKEADAKSVANLRQLLRDLLFERLVCLALPRITLDFHGSVQSTMRHAEGTAVGFNKKNDGQDLTWTDSPDLGEGYPFYFHSWLKPHR